MQGPCPHCQRLLRLPDGAEGRYLRCPACGQKFPHVAIRVRLDDEVYGWLMQDAEAATRAHDERMRARFRAAPPVVVGPRGSNN